MRMFLATYGSRGDVEPVVGLSVRWGAIGTQVRVCAPDRATEECDALVVNGVVPAGVCR